MSPILVGVISFICGAILGVILGTSLARYEDDEEWEDQVVGL